MQSPSNTWIVLQANQGTITVPLALNTTLPQSPFAAGYNTTFVFAGDQAVQRQMGEFYDAHDGDDARVRQVCI